METFVNVRSEHLNHHGYLFGGIMLKWIDEFAWIAASRDFTGSTMVTVGMDNIVFKHRVVNGSILRFHVDRVRIGTRSVTYCVTVYADAPGAREEVEVFTTNITFCNINEEGKAQSLPPVTE